MDPGDNPYDILGVDRNATSSQIKAAYRKAALRHHPDKQNTDEERRKATHVFAKISNAYEILSDPEQKREYDYSRSSQRRHNSGRASDPFEDSFFSSHGHHFHDPFRVFEEVFREEFGRSRGSPSSSNHHRATYRSPFDDDPFFARHGGMMDPFRPFFGGGFFDQGGMFSDPFEDMRRMQEDMHRQMGMFDQQQQQQQSQQQQQQGSSSSGPQRSVFYSSSSTSRMGGNGRGSVTTTTTTRMINGKKQTVTERVIEKADGTVEREFEKSGDEDFPAHLLDNDNDETTQRQSNRYLPESENNDNNNLQRRHSSKRHHSPHRRNSRHHHHQSPTATEEKPKRGSGWFW